VTTTAPATRRPEDLPHGTVPVAPDGLLSRVARACPEHGAESPCVARDCEGNCLVYWCPAGEHHFRVR
jgi:hypothetical protein